MTLDISAIRQRIEKPQEIQHSKLPEQVRAQLVLAALVDISYDACALCNEVERLRTYAQHTPICQQNRAKVEEGYQGGIPVLSYTSNPDWKCSCGLADESPPKEGK